jgi:Arc/MetJ family transcription regulator
MADDSTELLRARALNERLNAQFDALSPTKREALCLAIRHALRDAGHALSDSDERALMQFASAECNAQRLFDHFGVRLFAVFAPNCGTHAA